MRRQALQRRKRNDIAWYVLGFVAVQLALAVGVERYWPAVRDPEFADLVQIYRDRHAEDPGRPVVLVLGSSRTQRALRAGNLGRPGDPTSPLVLNFAVAGGGPMMHQVVLRRAQHAGVRPAGVFLEIMPMSLSRRDGTSMEERRPASARFTAAEVGRLWRYFAEPYRLCGPWLLGRVLPVYHHQAELRDALGLDVLAAGRPHRHMSFRDDYGWVPCSAVFSPPQVKWLTREAFWEYAGALTQPELAPGAVRAVRDVLRLCRAKGIPVVLVVPPESSAFRAYAPAVEESQLKAVRSLAAEFALPVIDARAWVEDAGFYDGHHTTQQGADRYTERFGREALVPYFRSPESAARPAVVRTTPVRRQPPHPAP
jgi:hypothetical protein